MMGEERRRAPRIRAYRPLRLYQPSTVRVVETLTKELSAGGLRCLSHTFLPVSTDVSMEFGFLAGEPLISARGRTVWFRALRESEQFDLGIEFSNISPDDKRRLSAYIDRLSSQPALSTLAI